MPLDVDPLPVQGLWFRHSRHGSEALPERPGPVPDSRWQKGEAVDALYLADQASTAWAEWYRHLAELGIPPRQWLPTYLWTWEVDLTVADLGDEDRLQRVGLPVPRPGRSTWEPFQEVGESLHRQGWAGLRAPSAARPGWHVLCLFRTGDLVTGVTAHRPPERITEVPVPPTGMTT